MKVKLLAYTPDPQKIVAAAAKLCYASSDIDSVMDKLNDEAASSFIDMLAEMGHQSPTEHAYFTFGIEGVSRALLAQITRHRIASFSVQSQRYVKESGFEYIIPPEIEKDERAKEIYIKQMESDQKAYDEIAAILKEKHLQSFLSEGQDEKMAQRNAEKKAIEDARFVLPNACDTKMIVTMNARSLNNFFSQRCCNRAQWEIKELADRMLKLCKEVSPSLFKKSGPGCVRGACPEGKMTCKKAAQMREFYNKLV